MLGPDQRAEVAHTDDIGGARQRAGRLLEQVLAPFDERTRVMRQDQPGTHAFVPDDRSDGAHLLVGGKRIDIAEVAKRDRRDRPR